MGRRISQSFAGAALLFARTALALADPGTHNTDPEFLKRYGPFGGSNPYSGSGGYNGNGNNGGSSNGFPGIFGTSLESAIHYRTIHGILASVAMVVLFPIGSILMRIIPGRFAIWAHALFQIMAYMLYIAGAALGIYLVRTVNIPFAGGNLLTNPRVNYHPILGLVTLATLFLQPMLGYIHHVRFKQLGRRTIWSHLHLWNGRIGITIGIIDGGLGLQLANAPRRIKTAYIVVAVILWSLWMLIAIVSEARRGRRAPAPVVTNRRYSNPAVAAHRSRRRSYTPDPEMSAAWAVGTPGNDSGSLHAPPVRPPRRGDRSPKVRQSHSTLSGNSPTRR